MENLSKRVRELRTTLGLNVSEFAKKMDTRHQNIAIIEAGTSKPGAEILSKISETFGVNLNWLVNGVGTMFLDDTVVIPPKKIIPESKFVEKDNELVLVGDHSKIVEMQKQTILYLQGTIDKLIAKGRLFSLDGLSFNSIN